MRTSWARGGATSTSSILRGSPAPQQTAALHLMGFPAVSDMVVVVGRGRGDVGQEGLRWPSAIPRLPDIGSQQSGEISFAIDSFGSLNSLLPPGPGFKRPADPEAMSFTNLYYKRVGIYTLPSS